jgi:hypothetical protein
MSAEFNKTQTLSHPTVLAVHCVRWGVKINEQDRHYALYLQSYQTPVFSLNRNSRLTNPGHAVSRLPVSDVRKGKKAFRSVASRRLRFSSSGSRFRKISLPFATQPF